MSLNEFFKSLLVNANLKAQAFQEAEAQGIKPENLNTFLAQFMGQAFDPQAGRLLNSKALIYAREGTYSSPLMEGTLGAAAQGDGKGLWVRP